jgi:hypothetical protein
VTDPETDEIIHVKYGKEDGLQMIPGRTEEEKEKFADLYPKTVGDFEIKEFSDYLVASMVCGPRAEDKPSILQKFTSLKWLPWESIASVAPSVFSTTKIVEPFSPVLEMAPGMKFELVPPRMTDKDEVCDNDNWGEINKRMVGKVNRETRESRHPVASKIESVEEALESKISGKVIGFIKGSLDFIKKPFGEDSAIGGYLDSIKNGISSDRRMFPSADDGMEHGVKALESALMFFQRYLAGETITINLTEY